MKWIYLIGIYLFRFALNLGSLFSTKAKLWINGRKNWEKKLKDHPFQKGNRIWVHCASLGEFEQGRPLIEKIKSEHPSIQIILTFFSPSGYEVRKNYPLADLICYLPLDTPRNSNKFLELIQPDLAIFVKYEFWYFFLEQLDRRKIPCVLISAIFRPQQHFFKSYGGFFKRMLFFFRHIFVQNTTSAEILKKAALTHYSLAGDTRVDRVLKLAKEKRSFPEIKAFVGHAPVLIAGSTWPADEEILLPFLLNDLPQHWKSIIAPHEIDERHIQKIEKLASGRAIRYSQLSKTDPAKEYSILIIDNIGMLSALYQFGQIAYIGGGFGRGIHNTLEPITFGLPVIFGPKYQKFEEAVNLSEQGGAFPMQSYEDLKKIFYQLTDTFFYREASQKAKDYIHTNQGASQKIYSFLKKERWL